MLHAVQHDRVAAAAHPAASAHTPDVTRVRLCAVNGGHAASLLGASVGGRVGGDVPAAGAAVGGDVPTRAGAPVGAVGE